MTAAEEFTEVFGAQHHHVRDLLLELAGAFGDRDAGQARALITTRDRSA